MDIAPFDIVVLTTAIPRTDSPPGSPNEGSWPIGTQATVLDPVKRGVALVEVSDESGRMLDLLDIPVDELRVIIRCRPGQPNVDLRETGD